jgi:hypothetical protein
MWQQVSAPHRLAEDAAQRDLAEVVAQAGRRVAWNRVAALVNDLPAECAEVVEERLFDEEVFGHGKTE